MTTYCKLCRHFWARFRRAARNTAVFLLAAELVVFLFQAAASKQAYAPYEAVLDAAWWGPLFLAALLFLWGYLLIGFLNDMTRESRAVYTLMTLPGPFWALPLAWATTFFAAACLLLCVQLALAFALYPAYGLLQHVACRNYQARILEQSRLETWDFPAPGFRKGLSYAFLRSPFLRALLPLSPAEAPLWCARLLLPPSLGAACLSQRRWKRAACVLFAAGALAYLHLFIPPESAALGGAAALLLEVALLAAAVLTLRRARNLA